jgi:DtxR family Mn-dependent transcriptional regulator
MPSSTVENYLKTVFVLTQGPRTTVSTGAMAEALGVTPGTITTMVKHLAAQGLLEHHPRAGVRLTAAGRALAVGVLRKHRLVETFLVRVLGMDWADVHEEAESLEHAISDRLLARIDAFLGHPKVDPHGDPIPTAQGKVTDAGAAATLADCALKTPWRVARITDQSAGFLEFVTRAGLKPGARIVVRQRDEASGVVLCDLGRGKTAALGLPEAGKIQIRAEG